MQSGSHRCTPYHLTWVNKVHHKAPIHSKKTAKQTPLSSNIHSQTQHSVDGGGGSYESRDECYSCFKLPYIWRGRSHLMLTSVPMQSQPKPHKLQVYAHAPHHSLPLSPSPLQHTPQNPKLPPIKFNMLKLEACMDRKFVRRVIGLHLKEFELDTHSYTPRRQEQLSISGMPMNQHNTAHALGWLKPWGSSMLVPSWHTPLQQSRVHSSLHI